MIRVFVLPCRLATVELPLSEKFLKSFGGNRPDIVCVGSIQQINMAVKTSWYMVLYENEWLSDGLYQIIEHFTENTSSDALVLFKKISDEKAAKSPRVFRRWVQLRHDQLMPAHSLISYEHLLDQFMFGD